MEMQKKKKKGFPWQRCRAAKYFIRISRTREVWCLHAMWPIISFDFDGIWSLSIDSRKKKSPNAKFRGNPFSGSSAGTQRGHSFLATNRESAQNLLGKVVCLYESTIAIIRTHTHATLQMHQQHTHTHIHTHTHTHTYFDVMLTVHLSIVLVINLLAPELFF